MTDHPPSRPTAAQRQIAALAAGMADANPDAAEELAIRLAYEAAQRKRMRGFAIMVRWNPITEEIELLGPGKAIRT